MPLNLIFIQPGAFTIDDNAIPGDNISVIRDSNGAVIFTFGHPADALGFTVSTPGVNMTVNFTNSMNAANFTIGSTDPDPMVGLAQSPESIVMNHVRTTGTVTLVSNTDITEAGNDFGSDIFGGAIIMSAVSGVATQANALETRTGLLEAETTTGGISIRNIGSVQIGALTADVDGLDVATSGDITLEVVGSIFLTEGNTVDAAEVIHGGSTSGDVTLTALGVNSDLIGNVDNGAITVPRGNLSVTVGRDIQLGTIGSDFNNDVVTNGSIKFTAGRDIIIDGFADILADNMGLDTGENLVFTAARNISIRNIAGTSASVTASGSGGGNAIITTGVNGMLTVTAPGSFALGSTSGDVIVTADRILIDGASGISAPSGAVSINTATAGREILLGSASDAATAIEISNIELNRIFTQDLTIGSDEAGTITVTSALTVTSGGNAAAVTLQSGDGVFLMAGMTVLGDLTLRGDNDVVVASGVVLNVPGAFNAFADAVGDDDAGGIANFAGVTINAASITISGNDDNDSLTGSNNSDTIVTGLGVDFVDGGTGSDTLTLAGNFGASDSINGGLNDDVLVLGGDYSTKVKFGISTLTNVEVIRLEAGDDYNLATHDTTVAAAAILTVNGSQLNASDRLTFDGSAEVDGALYITGGNAKDTLTGGDGNDRFTGGLGGDTISGKLGSDRFTYGSAADSTGLGFDTVKGADFTADKWNVPVNITGIDALIGSGVLGQNNFDAQMAAAADAAHLQGRHAVLFTPDSGSFADTSWLVIDLNNVDGYQGGADLAVQLVNPLNTSGLGVNDFI